jgi:hypothetical protein
VKRTRVVTGRTVLVTAAISVCLAGCSVLSPSVISSYPAADGINVSLPGTSVGLRNLVVVGTAKDAPATVVGALVNNGSTTVHVTLQADLGPSGQPAQTAIDIEPHSSVQIGPDQQTTMEISDLAVAPGAVTTISAATQIGGRVDAQVPVMLAEGPYASLTAAPTPTETPTPTDTPSSTETPSSTDSPSSTPTTTKSPKGKKKSPKSTSQPTSS